MEKFIYVFSKEDCDRLSSRGLTLVQSDETRGVFVFLNTERMDFAEDGIRLARSDTLTF